LDPEQQPDILDGRADMTTNLANASIKATHGGTALTGAVTRTVGDRLGDVYNVLDFGADPTGANPSTTTAAIQAAVTAASGNGTIFFPKGAYSVNSAILIGSNASLVFRGVGNGSSITANFNGFIFDTLSTPYNANITCVIECLSLQNSYTGNNWQIAANGTWSASGSPVSITLSGSNPGVAAGGALYINDSRFSTNSVFVGMITSVASWPTVTVSSTAIASGATSNLGMHVVQAYLAGASWSGSATTITMSTTPPVGIGSGQYYVYDYDYILSDPKTNFNFGVATWSGTTLTLTPGTTVVGPSIGSADRLWLAPVAGCVRYSSVVIGSVRDCLISGFIGVTSSEDKIVANDPTLGAAEGFGFTVDRCNFSNPAGCSAVAGQTGIYLQNNSLASYNSFNSLWCGIRLSGTACAIIGGRAEVCYFGYILGGDSTSTNNVSVNSVMASVSMESNLLGLYVQSGGNVNLNAIGAICNAVNPIGGFFFNNITGVIQNSSAGGNFGTGWGMYFTNTDNNRYNLTLISCSAFNNSTPSQGWHIPTNAWWGTCIQCDNPPLRYLFANLPGVSTNPAAVEGDEFNITDGTNGLTWGATVTNTGTHTTHYKVRYNGTTWTVVGQ
jgi:hypothetical protein